MDNIVDVAFGVPKGTEQSIEECMGEYSVEEILLTIALAMDKKEFLEIMATYYDKVNKEFEI